MNNTDSSESLVQFSSRIYGTIQLHSNNSLVRFCFGDV